MTKQEKATISEKVGEYFLRVVKNHNYYARFKKSFLDMNGMNPKIINLDRHSAYKKAMLKFSDEAENEYREHRHEDSIYEYITIFINMVLRHYLEQSGVNPRKLGMVGQELFDLSCYGVFGDKYFTDMEQMNQRNGNMRAPRNDKEAWLMAEYEQRRRSGENIDFETFMRERTNVPDDEFWNGRRDEMCQRHDRDMGMGFLEDEYEDGDDAF